MGGTRTHIAAVGSEGEIAGRVQFGTCEAADASAFVAMIANAVAELDASTPAIGIGIGAPCANASTGCIEAATDLPWPSPIPLASMVREATGLPTWVTNDANAAAIGEMMYGTARGLENFIMLTLGTGVGAGVVVDGHLLSGSRGFAGELGHVRFPFAANRECGCGRKGCLQTVASAGGVVRTALGMLADDCRDSSLREMDASTLTAKDVYDHAERGDALAREVFEFTGDCLGSACAEFAALADPDAIVLFGGVARALRFMERTMRRAFERDSLHLYRGRVKILESSLPDADAAILGAAALPLYLCNDLK